MKNYRCSCCNEMKKIKGNTVYKLWDQRLKPENSGVVCICRGCNLAMLKHRFIGVKQFLKK